jgi:hypothetical protein
MKTFQRLVEFVSCSYTKRWPRGEMPTLNASPPTPSSRAGELQFIDFSRVQEARKRTVETLADEPLIAGFDVSGGGAAWNVIRFRPPGLFSKSVQLDRHGSRAKWRSPTFHSRLQISAPGLPFSGASPYIYCGERHSRPPRPGNQRDDREADSRRGPNPQRGEPSCRSRPRISSPSRAFSPPAISGAETAGAVTFHLIVPRSRALMGVWLTTPRRETAVI